MDNDKKGLYGLITVIALIITQIVLRSIGIDNTSAQVLVTILVIACTLVIIGTYKNKNKGQGAKYNITVAILMVLASISTGVSMIMSKYSPDIIDKYSLLFLAIQLISFFSLTFYLIIYRIIYEFKKRK